ncbi:hypothetical protein IV203_026632 [Nitzschia inconspicua]|uniref:Uncharacterized protein n=1 Tax=Nitzschia inconspicua TaxID=303405 RepID=A0A9K3LJM2_9STRA|nr:hypothetical protein IV203_026632 [Nitzschia inconspicua]
MESMQGVQGIPTFPPFCAARISDSENCSVLGITIPCHKAFSAETLDAFGDGLLASHIWTFLVTLVIGVASLWNIKEPWDFRRHSLMITCGLYAVETSFFAIIRFFFGVCKPLVALAALHNLFEWSIVLHVAHGTTNRNVLCKRLGIAALFINVQIIICLCVPDFETSLGLEMVFGLMMDFGIPLLFLSQFSCPHRKKLYGCAAAAHSIHLLGTILPLVFAIHFSSSHASWFGGFFLEILINITVPLTHFLYCYWSYQIDYLADETGITISFLAEKDQSISTEKGHCSIDQQHSGSETVETSKTEDLTNTKSGVSHYCEPRRSGKTDEVQIRDVWRFLTIGFFLGLVPLLVVPKLLMKECEGGDRCFTQSYVTKTSVVSAGNGLQTTSSHDQDSTRTALVDILKSQNPGLVSVRVLRMDGADLNDSLYHTVETWKDVKSLTGSSISVSNVMAGRNVKALDAFTEVKVAICQDKEIGVVKVKTGFKCPPLWNILDGANYCGWVPGCKYMKELDGLLSLYMKDGSVVNAVGDKNKVMSFHVEVLSQTQLSGFKGSLSLREDLATGLCDVNYSFQIILGDGSGKISSFFYDSFIEQFIPKLHEMAMR